MNVGILYGSRADALQAPKGTITLSYCTGCGLIHNRTFDPSIDIFVPGYEVALHHSETFCTFIKSVAQRLTSRFDLYEKKILEIGCGDAYFLRTLAAFGNNECIGIDPTVSREGEIDAYPGTVRLIRDRFNESYQDLDVDFVCCLSVFEDISELGPFLAVLYKLTADQNASVYFEVFNAWRALEQQEVWSPHYEQCNYFSPTSLQNVFWTHGFQIENLGSCYGGDQYIFVEARAHTADVIRPVQDQTLPQTIRYFKAAYNARKKLWTERFDTYRKSSRKVVLWGLGGKGITFLNSVENSDIIEYVAEINPDKQGKFVPGSGQEIMSPAFLTEYRPDTIIITNPLYEAEMRHQAGQMGLSAEFLVA